MANLVLNAKMEESEVILQRMIAEGNEKAKVVARLSIVNDSLGPKAKLYAFKDWSGHPRTPYPDTILKGYSGELMHVANPPTDQYGSKAAVIYSGSNEAGVDKYNCYWLLAWHVPGDGNPNKVYVEAGDVNKYPKDAINWETVKTNLENSTSQSPTYSDPDTEAEAAAKIGNGNKVALAARFNVKDI